MRKLDIKTYNPLNYKDILDSFGYSILEIETRDDYQGDTVVLFSNHSKLGFLRFGWGSCSVCDALQSCFESDDPQKSIDELQNSLFHDIRWFVDHESALQYFKKHDWQGDYWNPIEFVQKCIKLVESLIDKKD